MRNQRKIFDCIVVGCGPAGITAAIQLKRIGLSIKVFEKTRPGGLLLHAGCVENFPGICDGIRGAELADIFLKKLSSLGVTPVIAEVKKWQRQGEEFVVETDNQKRYFSKSLIIATGTKPRDSKIKIEGECSKGGKVVRDFLELCLFPPSSVIVLGGGDAAFDYALSLASKGWNVKLVFRRKKPTALGLLVRRVALSKRIEVFPDFSPTIIVCDSGMVNLHGISSSSRKLFVIADYLLLAIGRKPEDALLRGLRMPSNMDGSIKSVPGLFIAGDVRRKHNRQAIIAAGDGMASAMAAGRYLMGQS